METQPNNTEAITFLSIDDVPADTGKVKKFVIYATSEAVDFDGVPVKKIPLCLVEDVDTNLTDALASGGALYTVECGWLIEYVDAEAVSDADLAILKIGMPDGVPWNIFMPAPVVDEWDEYIDLPAGVCKLCGGTGTIQATRCANGSSYTEYGDCECEMP